MHATQPSVNERETGNPAIGFLPWQWFRSSPSRKPVHKVPDKPTWDRMMMNAMSGDFSWDNSARKYLKLYEMARLKRKG